MYINKVEICGVNTSKLPLYKDEEMKRMIARIKEGDKETRDEFIKGNLRLVLSVIQRFANRGENMDDLFQVGCIGLIKALNNFDTENYDVRFSTYAVPMIAGEIRRYLRDDSPIRVSRSLRDLAYKAMQAKEKLMREKQREPSVSEVAKELEVPDSEVAAALEAIQDPVSLFEPVFHDSEDAVFIMDQIKDGKNTDEMWTDHISLFQALDKLHPRERYILDKRFFEGKTQMEISSEIGISQAQVSRLEKNALNCVKNNMYSDDVRG